MLIKKKLNRLLLNLFNIQDISFWKYSLNHPNSEYCEWKNFNNHEINPLIDRVWIKPGHIGRKGWFLFGIKHKSLNKRSYGIFKSGKWGISQGRPMYPARRRWRVLRIGASRENYLELSMLDSSLLIKELWLIPILQCDAWRRIKRRMSSIILKGDEFVINKKKLWKKYNKALTDQKSRSYLLNYSSWINSFEKNFYKKHFNKNIKINYDFDIQNNVSLKKIKNNNWVIYLENNDSLNSNIYLILNKVIQKNKHAVILYGDEDSKTDYNLRFSPNFKSSWNRELFLSNYDYGKSWIIKGNFWNKALNFLEKYKYKISIYNIVFYISNELQKKNLISNSIIHIPLILYHTKSNYLQNNINKKNNLSNKFLRDSIKRNPLIFGNLISFSSSNKRRFYNWALPKETLLSIIIPTRDNISLLKNCIHSINKFNAGCNIEIIVVDNNSSLDETRVFLENFKSSSIAHNKKVLSFPGEFNYSKINNYAAGFTKGNVILLLNNDTEFLKPLWGHELASNALRPGMGCIGAKLLYKDSTIQHAGVILGIGGIAGHAFKYFDSCDKYSRLNSTQEYIAVTAACLAISRKNWDLLEGLDDKNLHVNYNDVDICLRAYRMGLKNLYLAQVELIHYESKTRGSPEGKAYNQWKKESQIMKKRWGDLLFSDPYYHPLLTLEEENFSISPTRKLNQFFR